MYKLLSEPAKRHTPALVTILYVYVYVVPSGESILITNIT